MAPDSPRKRVKPNPSSEVPAPTDENAAEIPLPTGTSPTAESPRRTSQEPTNETRDHSNRGVCAGAAASTIKLITVNRVGTIGLGPERLYRLLR
jgi:hypothetical protein